MMGEFVSDIKKIRERAREHMERGAVTGGYKADRRRVIDVLNDVLATEIVCVLRYKRHYFTASGIHSEAVKSEFLQHAIEEQQHADWAAERINQLGGEPNFNPDGLAARSHSEYGEGSDLQSMIRENLVAERIAIESYSLARERRSDDPKDDRRHPEDGRRACRRHGQPVDPGGWFLTDGSESRILIAHATGPLPLPAPRGEGPTSP
jgi:bacterioferritin